MKKFLLLLFCLIGIGVSASAGSYTIKFKTGSNTNTNFSEKTVLANVVTQGAEYLKSCDSQSNSFPTTKEGIRVGSSKGAGHLTLNLTEAGQVNATSIVVHAKGYNSKSHLTVNDSPVKTASATEGTSISYDGMKDYTFTFDGKTKITQLKLTGYVRVMIESITVNYDGGSTPDPELADAGLSFPQAEYTVVMGKDFEEPTLKKDTDAAAVYSSTVESVATVNPSTGVIKLVAAGTTTIKAHTVATATYKAGEASYTLTVNDPNAIKAQVVMANQDFAKNKYGKDKTVNWVSEDKKYTFVTSATVGPDKTTYPQYNSNNNPKGLRIYSSNGNVMTVNAPAGYKFVSAKATGSAGLKYNGSKTETSSGTEIALNNATSFTFESGTSSTMAITRFDFVLASDNPVVPDRELIAPVLTFSVPEGNYDPEGEAFNVEIKLNSDCYPKPEKIYYTINGKRAHAEPAEGATEHRTVYKDPISVSVADAQAATGNKHAKAMTINAYAANVAGESVVAATYTFGKRTVTEGTAGTVEVETPEELFLVMNNNVADSNNELAAPFEYKGEVNGKHTYELDIQTANEHGIRGQFYVRDGKANKEGTFFGPHSQYQTYTPTVQAGSMMKAVTTNHPAYVPIEFTGGNSPVYDMAFCPENASQTTEHINFGTENPEKEQQGIASGKVIVTYEPGKKNRSAYMTLQLTGSVITGIENVAVDGSEAPVRYYNLQGVQLPAAPAAGFYLEVQGSRATKRLAR